jgi:DNA polymerase
LISDSQPIEGTIMNNSSHLDRAQIARQVRQHLESLNAAGVEFLPAGNATVNVAATIPDTPTTESQSTDSVNSGPALFAAQASNACAVVKPSDDLPMDQRRLELQLLTERVTSCTRCTELVANRSRTVFGVGPIDVELCFIGEAPGQEEDRRGEPFVGDAGQLLNRIIVACGLKREEVYICNIVKCRPPKNRQPLPNEAANCREHLERQLELIRPKFICALGSVAAQNLLGTTVAISRLRGNFQDFRGIPVMCTFHPAYLLRSPEKKKEVWEDMKKLLERMGRPVPEPAKR